MGNNLSQFFKKYRIVSLILTGLIVLTILWFFVNRQSYLRLEEKIPPAPDISMASQLLVDHFTEMDTEIRREDLSAEKVGELALSYQANYFYDHAEACYRLAQELDKTDWRWWYYLGLLKEELGDLESAISLLQRALNENPDLTQAWLKLGNQYLKLNKFKEAEEALLKVGEGEPYYPAGLTKKELPNRGAFPLDAYASLSLATSFLKRDIPKKSIEILSELIETQPRFGPVYRLLGQAYFKLDDSINAQEFTERANDYESFMPPSDPLFDVLVLRSRNADFILKQSDLALKTQNYEWTRQLSEFMLQHNIEPGEALAGLIHHAVETYQFENVPELVERHYQSQINNFIKLEEMGLYLSRKDQLKFAIRYLTKASWLDPKAIKPRLEFIKILNRVGDYEKAIEQCQIILKLKSDDESTRIELGKAYYLKGDVEKARKLFQTILKTSPENEIAHIHLAILSEDEGLTDNALFHYSQSISINPRNTNSWVKRGNYLLKLGRWKDAKQTFNDALGVLPNDIDFLERMSWILSTCPDEEIRDGGKALDIARRLSSMAKIRPGQNMSCGIALATSFAEENQFDKAIGTIKGLIKYAETTQVQAYVPVLNQLLSYFQKRQPYRLSSENRN